jgi:carbamoylphosphate synthase large subunit
VLKGEYGSAGGTVRICADAPALDQAWQALRSLAPGMRLTLEAFVRGQGAICAGVAMAGQVLESVACLKLHVHPLPTSPSSVLRVVDHPGMRDALARLVQAMALGGWCEAEFILEPGAQAPCLIELNPRPSPLSALGALWGHDLALAMAAHLRGQAYRRPAPLTPSDTVALFPNEWARDPHSPHLRQGHHDLPDGDPALLRALWRSVGVDLPAQASV